MACSNVETHALKLAHTPFSLPFVLSHKNHPNPMPQPNKNDSNSNLNVIRINPYQEKVPNPRGGANLHRLFFSRAQEKRGGFFSTPLSSWSAKWRENLREPRLWQPTLIWFQIGFNSNPIRTRFKSNSKRLSTLI